MYPRQRIDLLSIVSEMLGDIARGRRARRDRLASQALAAGLAGWAQGAGFEALDALHPDTCDVWSEALTMVDEDKHREVGTAFVRVHARGKLYLFDSFAVDGRGGRATTALVTTAASLATLVSEDVLAGLPYGACLQRWPGRLAVHMPAPLDERLARVISDRLTRLEAAMPSVPGATRL